jgi:hypothetical protein
VATGIRVAMLTHNEVRCAAAELNLGEYADGLIQALRPAYRLDASPNGAHRVGDVPDLIAGEHWPRSARGVELTFIAQIETSMVPPLPGIDDEAVKWLATPAFVRLFTDLYDNPFEPNPVVALVADPEAERAPAAAPNRPPSLAGTDEKLIIGAFAELFVDAVPGWQLDECHPAVIAAGQVDHGHMLENAPLLDLTHVLHAGRRLDRGGHVLPQLLGTADAVQDDPLLDGAYWARDRALEDPAAWRLLLQLDDSFAHYGDGGGFYVVIPRADLIAGRYDRAIALTQTG